MMTESLNYHELERQATDSSTPRFGGEAVIVCDNLVKIYKVADLEAIALQGLDLVVEQGEFIAIVGASGSGKSTLLSILGGLVTPSAGEARVAGYDLLKMGARERTRYRRQVVGFVWQQTARNLLPYLTAVENVELPMSLDGRPRKLRRALAIMLLDQVGLGDRLHHRPDQLSGGEQQRVAIAIALANDPRVIFADEPTGELDSQTAGEVVEVLRSVNEENDVTVVVVTHDPDLSSHVSRTVSIRDGRTSTEVVRRSELDADGSHSVVAEEFAVLDRVGRLQLPNEYVDALQLERRVRLTLETDRINVWPNKDSQTSLSDDGGDRADTDETSDQLWRGPE
jgi:ABC-type lipoprotein export system ATPase subunit